MFVVSVSTFNTIKSSRFIMSPEERAKYIKVLINQPEKTAQDYARLGRAYEKHLILIKGEIKQKEKDFSEVVELFSNEIGKKEAPLFNQV